MILCVDVGGTGTKVGLVSLQGELSAVDSFPSQPPTEDFLQRLTNLIERTRRGVKHLGIAVAGFLDEGRTQLLYNSNLPWLEGFPLRQRLHEQFPDMAIEMEVDSNAAALAEYRWGSGQGHRRFLCLTCGTGLGVGMIVDGVPLRFAYGCMGDVGHIIVQPDGPRCACGGQGCAEVMVSSAMIAARFRERTGTPTKTTLRDVIHAAGGGDSAAKDVLRNAGEHLGVAMASMANTFFPDHIAIAGGLSAAGDIVFKAAESTFRKHASHFAQSKTSVSGATFGANATLIGAACPFVMEG